MSTLVSTGTFRAASAAALLLARILEAHTGSLAKLRCGSATEHTERIHAMHGDDQPQKNNTYLFSIFCAASTGPQCLFGTFSCGVEGPRMEASDISEVYTVTDSRATASTLLLSV